MKRDDLDISHIAVTSLSQQHFSATRAIDLVQTSTTCALHISHRVDMSCQYCPIEGVGWRDKPRRGRDLKAVRLKIDFNSEIRLFGPLSGLPCEYWPHGLRAVDGPSSARGIPSVC